MYLPYVAALDADYLVYQCYDLYERQPGWPTHLVRLAIACTAMVAVLGIGLWHWPHWSDWSTATRILRLGVLVAAGGGAFVAALFASGFRLQDLRAT